MEKEKENNKNLYYIIIAVVAVIVLVGGFLLIKGCSNNKANNEENNKENAENDKKEAASEESIIKAYGMSKEDAINIVKDIYNGDNYEFSADINEDSKYIVIVKNIITESTNKYLVDPTSTSKSFYEINE